MEFMTFKPTVDGTMRLVSVLIVGVLLITYSTVFEVEYSQKLIQLYMYPWWRILLVLLVLCADRSLSSESRHSLCRGTAIIGARHLAS